MTTTNNSYGTTSQDIESLVASLQAEVELDPTDLVSKISLATVLEQSNRIQEAKLVYQEVIDADPAGSMGAIALKALEGLEIPQSGFLEPPVANAEDFQPHQQPSQQLQELLSPTVAPRKKKPFQWFYDLPINRKQLIALLASEVLSVIALGMGARHLIETGLRSQLLAQASSEVAVTEINYNIKVNQMGFGFRGQSDNPAIANAVKASARGAIPKELQSQVEKILKNEVTARKIEYATLVGKDLRIIVGANANRQGEVFNPNNLVQEVFNDPRQIKASAIVKWSELQKEAPPLPAGFTGKDALIRYTVTAVKDPTTKQVIGALVSGDIVNGKPPIVKGTLKAFGSGYSAVYLHKSATKEFDLVTSLDKEQTDKLDKAVPNVALPDVSLMQAAIEANGTVVTKRSQVGGHNYTLAAIALPNIAREDASGTVAVPNKGEPVAVLVRGTREDAVEELLDRSLSQQMSVLILAILIITAWAMVLRGAIPRPIENLRKTAQKFSSGDRTARAEIFATDEVGELATTFNQMADSVNASANALEEQSRTRQAEADFQRQEKERLQQGVIAFLLDIEDAQQGNLTVKAKVDEGAIGSIADAFNATIRSLREIVTQVKAATTQVQSSTFSSESSVAKLSTEATTQAQSVTQALNSVEEIGQSIQSVADSAQKAAAIAREAVKAAKEGGETMDLTVGSIQNIRSSVAETSKKVKRLAESSQEISKVVSIISGISEKTNLLAFNASIEAARAGEHGQGFRVVADEVRRLAERVTDSTKEIEQLVSTIQQETAEVLQTMEASTTQVVTGTQLVGKTKQTLQGLANISNTIDELLQSISQSTVSQAIASQTVNQTMHEVAAIAQNTSQESEAVSVSLKQLVGVAEELQNSVSRFQVEK